MPALIAHWRAGIHTGSGLDHVREYDFLNRRGFNTGTLQRLPRHLGTQIGQMNLLGCSTKTSYW